jgi:3',5'-cyclic AMP phosphodiesterase CpdA
MKVGESGMRTIVHLSDLHFGRTDDALLEPLAAVIRHVAPHLVAVSGDLTQRARTPQFKAARAFLDQLPKPQIVVPGNHDVPLYDVLSRFTRPLAKYRRYVTSELEPYYADEEIAALGINTARSLTFKRGRINARQMESAQRRLCSLPAGIIKIIVTHHPFDLPTGYDPGDRVGRASLAMEMLSSCRCDLLLAGHLHISGIGSTVRRYVDQEHEAIIVQAGTATSTRGRGEVNSFNVLHVEQSRIEVQRNAWDAALASFTPVASERFERTATGWKSKRT